MWKVAVRPRWIAALLLALAVAAGFVLLSQWQLSRSVSTGTVVERPTEKAVELSSVAEPQQPIRTEADGQMVTVTGAFDGADTVILESRLNDGTLGYWVVSHLQTPEGAGLAVALGWSSTKAEAEAVEAPTGEVQLLGRYMADEAPQSSDFEKGRLTALSTADLVNVWSGTDPLGTFNGFLVLSDPPAGLTAISAPAPEKGVELNLLNLFYAAEWVIFAGFAVFLWWRLVKDAWLREQHP